MFKMQLIYSAIFFIVHILFFINSLVITILLFKILKKLNKLINSTFAH